MAESVDALVSNTSGATRAGSTPALGTRFNSESIAKSFVYKVLAIFLFLVVPHVRSELYKVELVFSHILFHFPLQTLKRMASFIGVKCVSISCNAVSVVPPSCAYKIKKDGCAFPSYIPFPMTTPLFLQKRIWEA